MAFAVNLLQLWDGVGRWIERKAAEPAASDEALIAEGPSAKSVADELATKNEKRKETLTRNIRWGKNLAVVMAGAIYVALLAVPYIDKLLPKLVWGVFCVVVGFGTWLWIGVIIWWNSRTVKSISDWTNEQARAGATMAKIERQKAEKSVQRARSSPRPSFGLDRLVERLARSPSNRIHMTFSDIEMQIGARLPDGAKISQEWWTGVVQPRLNGRYTLTTDLENEVVVFSRDDRLPPASPR